MVWACIMVVTAITTHTLSAIAIMDVVWSQNAVNGCWVGRIDFGVPAPRTKPWHCSGRLVLPFAVNKRV
uniref:Putative secreted protein n=1 Tax=Anopheles darlingi TaxID=43151 RepID=A0A2M4D7K8_ANODA